MFFEDIRSERLLMQLVADKLSVRWYVGYNLDEPLPDHSSLTRIRERYGVEVFRRFFEAIVEQCQAAGLVWGKELYFDGTKVQANASLDSLKPRFFVEAHLADLFRAEAEELPEETGQQPPQTEAVASRSVEQKETPLPTRLPVSLSQEEYQELAQHNEEHHDWTRVSGSTRSQGKGSQLSTHGRSAGEYHRPRCHSHANQAGSGYGLSHPLCCRWRQSTHHSPSAGDAVRGHGQPTDVGSPLEGALPLEAVAQASDG
jgi:hypothetical protein